MRKTFRQSNVKWISLCQIFILINAKKAGRKNRNKNKNNKKRIKAKQFHGYQPIAELTEICLFRFECASAVSNASFKIVFHAKSKWNKNRRTNFVRCGRKIRWQNNIKNKTEQTERTKFNLNERKRQRQQSQHSYLPILRTGTRILR